ncbi:molybdopterin synthase [Halococcoides cellulosivorans]|uniref:Molybdopterin synthase n=1 Tax=Halococcoides cellulosivorans TaxID=1679096 RepID=A0A2R4X165_9EURY|nr:molybdopterin synthase [Halococcoides cellulosivorans]AWB27537.1 molybdopterin synthase [Halococcoides cellulosivorans]
MKVIRVVGPSDAGKTTLIERLADCLADLGRVGTVKHIACEPTLDTDGTDTARHRTAGAAETYGLTDDGDWFATGEELSLTEALDRLAVDCRYALVEGYGTATLPTVALGDADAETVIAAGETADDVDLDAVIDATEAVDPYETLESLVARAKASPDADRAGAIATFTGRVRTLDDADDDPTEWLEFERYETVADERMAAIREELTARDGVYEVFLHHETGVVDAGEDVVYVVVLADHRREAFETVEDGIDRLKDEVPLFKREVTVTDEFWAHE